MKCTWNNCGKETHKKCPNIWRKHMLYDPRILNAFFDGIQGEEYIPLLEAFVCSEHLKDYKAYMKRSTSAKTAAQKRKTK